jgi:ketosteroid isomerase-like protein
MTGRADEVDTTDQATARRILNPEQPSRGSVCTVDRDDVMRWVAEYERAWRSGDVAAVARLFTDDARYRTSPYAQPKVGHAEIGAFWLDDDGRTFSVGAQPVAVEGRDAVVRLEVRYREPVAQEYRDLWVLRFAEDGRVEDFEEWAYWPGKPYSAGSEGGG